MRKLASFQDPAPARALDDLLSAAEVPALLRRTDSGEHSVWIVSEQDMSKALAILRAFEARPELVAQGAAAAETAPVPGAPTQVPKKRFIDQVLEAPVTASLFALCVLVALYTSLGGDEARVEQFTIARSPSRLTLDFQPWGDLQAGQWWRLFTPILLHFHPFHLLFNVFWLRDLGVPAERYQGSLKFALFLAWSAAVSNAAQLAFGHSPNFGGLSGVVYALVGYLWARGYADPHSGIALPKGWVVFFVVWMALGFTGLLNGILGGGIANYCHLGGFAAGVVYGYIAARIAVARVRA